MSQFLKSFMAGIVSGVLTHFACIRLIGYTAAFAMPRGFPMALWDAVVIYGLGATLAAFLIHFLAIRAVNATPLPALLGFVGTLVAMMAGTGVLIYGGNALAACVIGALVASMARDAGLANSTRPKPLRESA